MRPTRRVIRELFWGVCQHRDRYHLQLLLSGTVDEERDGRRVYCVLNMFVSGKRFLCKDLVDELYCRFLERWSVCSPHARAVARDICRRESMTRHTFVLLSYFYVVRCMERVARNLSCLYLHAGMTARLEHVFRRYNRQKIDSLVDNVTFQGLNDLHQFVFSLPFGIPVPNQATSPCVTFLRAREYETGCDLPVYHRKIAFGQRRYAACGDARVSALVAVLRDRCREVPCGNPLYVMAKVFVERYCRRTPRFLVPLGNRTLRCTYRSVATTPRPSSDSVTATSVASALSSSSFVPCAGSAPVSTSVVSGSHPWGLSKLATFAASVVLRNGLISSLIDLPVLCYCKTKCSRYAEGGVYEAILCDNCGHCLNMGKDKLEGNHSFALNCIFYCRDRQEKSVIYSTHNDTAHCSLCGNQYLSRERIYELLFADLFGVRTLTVRWRAVIGSNAACGVFGPGTRLDVLLPCSSRTCYGTVVLRDLSVDRITRLISHSGEFLCPACQNVYRETCLDVPGGTNDLCEGCSVYASFCCAELRRRHVE